MIKRIPGIVKEPDPVETPITPNKTYMVFLWSSIGIIVMMALYAAITGVKQPVEPRRETYFATSTVESLLDGVEFGAPVSCDVPKCPDRSFLSRFVYRLDVESATPTEIRDVLNRCYVETRFTPTSVSDTGDWGICQINARAWPDVDTSRLLTDPEYAAVECLRVYRVMRRACGADWQCCYRHGVNGCKNGK
jgi:hypothetical protein